MPKLDEPSYTQLSRQVGYVSFLRRTHEIELVNSDMLAAFREMCTSKNEALYLKLLPQLTDEFRQVSEVVNECEKNFNQSGRTDLAKLVRHIQEQERIKLQATIGLQALQKAQAFESLPWQNGQEAAWSEPVHQSSGDTSSEKAFL